MSNYFVNSNNGSNSDNGSTMDLAWATVEHAVESGALSPGDFVYVSPDHSEIPTSDISPAYSGNPENMIKVIGWPKASISLTQADWTNGSTTVDNVVGATLTRSGHCGRWVTAPDGNDYFITYITDSNTFVIDREYAGNTVTGASGASTIKADDYYTEAQAIDDSSWTIKKTDWDSNNPARGIIDFNDGNYQLYFYPHAGYYVQGLEVKDSADSNGIINSYFMYNTYVGVHLKGLLIKQTTNNSLLLNLRFGRQVVEETIIEGSGSGSSQRGINAGSSYSGGGFSIIRNCAIYNCGDYGIDNTRQLILENVNIGIEQANGDDDINCGAFIQGRDVKLGGTNGLVQLLPHYGGAKVQIENYQKVLGEHRTFYSAGYYEKAAVSGETPNKKVSDYVLKITPNNNYAMRGEFALPVLVHEIEADDSSKSYKYWVYNDTGSTLNDTHAKEDIWMKLEYVKTYDDGTEYIIATEYSDEIDIADAADADDWDYLEITGIQPAVASKVRISIFYTKYFSSGNVFIDPAVVVS